MSSEGEVTRTKKAKRKRYFKSKRTLPKERDPAEEQEKKLIKRRKRRKQEKEKEKEIWKEVKNERINNPIQFRTVEEQCDEFIRLYEDNNKGKMTSIEKEDLLPSCEHFVRPKMETWSTSDIEKFIEEIDIDSCLSSEEEIPNGSPYYIILSRSAIRALEIIKNMGNMKKTHKVAKLFAKHKKIEDQETYLETHCVKIAVGTPNRILNLISNNKLHLTKLKHLILDMDKDVKTYTFLDNKQLRTDFFELYSGYIHEKVKSNQVKISMF